MSLKFSANLNFLFTENGANILQRFRLAAQAGFRAVETGLPSDVAVEDLRAVQRETGLEVALLNICLGSADGGEEFGVTAVPGKEEVFAENLRRTVVFAKALNCKKIHLMAGKLGQPATELNHRVFEQNLRFAASILEPEQIMGVIEPISKYGVPGYYLDNYDRAIEVVQTVASPSIRIMVDLYHMQGIRGDITHSLTQLQPLIGHVQIAQAPNRNEPNTPGELDYGYVFGQLRQLEYDSWIGCEYRPTDGTEAGLTSWLKEFGLTL